MTMLEKMAKAGWLEAQQQIPGKHRMTDWAAVPPKVKKNFTGYLIAALKVLRTPPEAILDAAQDSCSGIGDRGQLADEFAAVIDSILAEKPT